MKVAYLTSMYPDISHTFVVREVRALRAQGLDVVTFSVRRPNGRNILGADAQQEANSTRWLVHPHSEYAVALIWAVLTRPLRSVRALKSAVLKWDQSIGRRLRWFCYLVEAVLLARWLVGEEFDHLHCHFGNNGASTGMLAAQLAGIPFSMTCHGSELREFHKHRLTDKVAQASFVACVSHYGRAQLMSIAPPQYWHKLHVVRCGIPKTAEASGGANGKPFRILCVGRLSAEKGHLVLLAALAELRDQRLDFRCTLVGDGPMRPAITARAEELNLSASLTFTGALAPDGVAERYRSADVVVLPSFYEGVPVVLMEAMERGLPVVATRVGGVPELVEHGQNGLVVAPGDARALAEALRRILHDAPFARTLGKTARCRVRDEFNIDLSARRLRALFQRASAPLAEDDVAALCRSASCPPQWTAQDC